MENTIGKKIASDVFSKIASEYSGNKTLQNSYSDFKSSVTKELPESEKVEATGSSSAGGFAAPLFGDMKEQGDNSESTNYNFFKEIYDPNTKSLIAAYKIVNDTNEKFIEVLNIHEIYTEDKTFFDKKFPYDIKIFKFRLPKSQIEILDEETGKEGFKFIRIPYWLVKKEPEQYKIKRKDISKRLDNKYNSPQKNLEGKVDDSVVEYISTLDGDKQSLRKIEVQKGKSDKDINSSDISEEDDYTKEAKNNITSVFDNMPKLKDLKPFGLKYSVKSIKNLLVPKTQDGKYKDNRWIRDEMPFPKELDILNVLIQSRLAIFYFKNQAKKRNKQHYVWAMDINKEDLDNFPIPQMIFDTVSRILKGGDEEITKAETKEATGSSSSGSYEQPAIWAKSSTKKHWKGARKTQLPGGKFVEVKKKCQKFPYCNQGDIKALNIFENEHVKEVIKNISNKHNISENVIKNILIYEFDVFRKYKK
jgi:hypothetical protein